MQHAPPEVQAMFAKLVADLDRDNLERERKVAEADPRRHKLSRTFSGRTGLRYHWTGGGVNGRGQRVWYCWSVHRNVAGYFLGWRQVQRRDGVVRRDQWVARKTRRAVIAIAQRRREAFNWKRAGTVGA